MGKAIVYCRNCGTGLREEDFTAGRAVSIDLNVFCAACAGPTPPVRTAPPSNETPRSHSLKSSTSRVPVMHRSTRRFAGDGAASERSGPGLLPILGGVGAAVLLFVIAIAISNSGGTPQSPPAPRPAPPASPAPKVARKSSPPTTPVPPPPPRKRVTETDSDAVERKMREELSRQKAAAFDRNLGELEKMIRESDPGTRTEEIDRMLDSLAMASNSRPADIAKLRTLHEERLKSAPPPASAPAAPAAKPPPKRPASVPPGLEGHWTLDTIADGRSEDISGLGRHAVVKGTLETAPGRIGKGIYFRGNDSYLELPRVPALNKLQEGSYTLAAWFKPDDVPKGPEDSNGAYYAVVIKTGMHLGLSYSYSGGGSFEMMQWFSKMTRAGEVAGQASPPQTWHHLVGVVDRAKERTTLFVNGRLLIQVPWAEGSRTAEPNYRRKPWYIGIGLPRADKWGWSARGVIDDVRIYSRALSERDVSELFADTDRLAANPPGPVRTLFDGADLKNWETPKGEWRVVDGTMAADLEDTSSRTAHTKESFGSYELTAQLQVKVRTYIEIHIHSYGVNYGGHLEPGGWSALKVVVRGAEDSVALDRATLKRNVHREGADSGWFGFYANGAIRVRDVRLKLLE